MVHIINLSEEEKEGIKKNHKQWADATLERNQATVA